MNSDIMKYYTTGVDAPISPAFTHIDRSNNAYMVNQVVDDWLIELPDGKTALWQVLIKIVKVLWLDKVLHLY